MSALGSDPPPPTEVAWYGLSGAYFDSLDEWVFKLIERRPCERQWFGDHWVALVEFSDEEVAALRDLAVRYGLETRYAVAWHRDGCHNEAEFHGTRAAAEHRFGEMKRAIGGDHD